MNGHFWGMGWAMWLVPVVIILLIYFLIKNTSQTKQDSETPLEILKKRYAKGEITKEQFEEMKKNIS